MENSLMEKEQSMKMKAFFEAPLDKSFVPMLVFMRHYEREVAQEGGGEPLEIALERNDGCTVRSSLRVHPSGRWEADTFTYAERIVKFLLWSSGGWRLMLAGNRELCQQIQSIYSLNGARAFDVRLMETIYERPFTVDILDSADMPERRRPRLPWAVILTGAGLDSIWAPAISKSARSLTGRPCSARKSPGTRRMPRIRTIITRKSKWG
jgi:hypothetical protein